MKGFPFPARHHRFAEGPEALYQPCLFEAIGAEAGFDLFHVRSRYTARPSCSLSALRFTSATAPRGRWPSWKGP